MDIANVLVEVQARLDGVTSGTSDTDMLAISKQAEGLAVVRTIFDAELQLRMDALSVSNTTLEMLKVTKAIDGAYTDWSEVHLGQVDGSNNYQATNRQSIAAVTQDLDIVATADGSVTVFTFNASGKNPTTDAGWLLSASTGSPNNLISQTAAVKLAQKVNQTFTFGQRYKLSFPQFQVKAAVAGRLVGLGFLPATYTDMDGAFNHLTFSGWDDGNDGMTGLVMWGQQGEVIGGLYTNTPFIAQSGYTGLLDYNIDAAGDMTVTNDVGTTLYSYSGVLEVGTPRNLWVGTDSLSSTTSYIPSYQQLGVEEVHGSFNILLPTTTTSIYSSVVVSDFYNTFDTYNMTVNANGALIDGTATVVMSTVGQTLEFVSPIGLSNWSIA